jgi:hypothetical protein
VLPLVSALALVVALIATPLLMSQGGRARRVAAISQPTEPSTTTTSTSEPVADTTTTGSVAAPPSVPTTTITRSRPTITTTALVCRNSYDARCGPFRWDPDPGPNEPSTAQISYSPANPHVGEEVTFHVTYFNPDGPAGSCENTTSYGDGTTVKGSCAVLPPPGGCKTAYGPWTPPARKAESVAFDITNSYKAAGTYTVMVEGDAGDDPCDQPTNPYRDTKSGSTTITVNP